MMFYMYFKSFVNKNVEVVLKNEIKIYGVLLSVDSYLNCKIKIDKIENADIGISNLIICYIRGSNIKFLWLKNDLERMKGLMDASRYRVTMCNESTNKCEEE
ncbi:putative U6 snRNA-associated Sm-like protein [Hamiltosporidium tvaerminnensis]|uniref:Putative U6 snRNA-associated Sm-like protein n=2 Tax=Hamiltosporidium TaxID=1176354 RepID=A0A4Q9L4E5_9MICR|nr:putative U6 snRNA-associated Sm-like protein [Hamiltosporidium tvaerminnensis]TBU01985.1 putative U6 snRNA-associated Sm-like protein [Hamiltosporidium tvaerminnensis]TBU07743.1 putative U6 snRNA-associated Sm-like protein [Hamiltosporidium magnivora]